MKRKGYLALIMAVTVACIIAGGLYHTGGFANIRHTGVPSDAVPLTAENGILSGNVDKLFIRSEIMEISLTKGDTFRAEYAGDEKYRPAVSENGGTLQIIQKSKGFLHFNFGFPESRLTVTVPESVNIPELQIDSDTGNIHIQGISFGSTKLSTDTGRIEMTDSAAGDCRMETDTGKIVISGCAAGNADLESDTGDISVTGSSFGDISIESDTGDVEVETASAGAQQDGGAADDPSLDLSTDTGDVTVYGEKMPKAYRYDGRGKNRIKIESDTGDITIIKTAKA